MFDIFDLFEKTFFGFLKNILIKIDPENRTIQKATISLVNQVDFFVGRKLLIFCIRPSKNISFLDLQNLITWTSWLGTRKNASHYI